MKYGLFQILILSVNLVTMLYVTRKVSPEGYAEYGVFLSIAALMQPFSSFSSERLVQVNKYKYQEKEFDSFMNNLIFITYVCSFLLIFISFILFNFIYEEVLLLLASILVGFRALKSFKLFEYTVENQAVKYGLVGFSVKILGLLLVFLGFEYFVVDGFYFILSVLFSELIVCLAINYNRMFRVNLPNKDDLLKILIFGLPLVLSTLPAWVAHESGRLILNYYSTSQAGLLTLGIQLGAIYMFFNNALGNSIVKNVYNSYESTTLDKLVIKITLLQIFVAGVFFLGFLLFYKLILDVKFYLVVDFFYIILAGFTIQSFALIPVYLSSYQNNTKVVLSANSLAAFIFLVVVIIRVENLTAVDISIAFFFAMLSYSLRLWWEFKKEVFPYFF